MQTVRRATMASLPILLLLLLAIMYISFPHLRTPEAPRRLLLEETHFQVARSTCSDTLYPDLCVDTLTSFQDDLTQKTIPQIIYLTVDHVRKRVQKSATRCSSIARKTSDPCELMALEDCRLLFTGTMDELGATMKDLNSSSVSTKTYDVKTLLSAAMTNQYTCLDGFSHCGGTVRDRIEDGLYNISKLVSNSLAIAKKIRPRKTRRAQESGDAFPEYGGMRHGFPSWVSAGDRRLLQANVSSLKADLVVAKDGSGNFTTISDAVAAAPNKSDTRFIIYIKAGGYFENVDVPSSKTNLMFVGDGMWKTVVKASRNVIDGWTTYRSATVGVSADGFMARDMTFENSAGPSKHQAVAFRSGSDRSALYRCSFAAYQDTLYVHSLRQFYRECDVYGTVDFIFGNAAAVFQNCKLYARRPNPNQQNIFTAQGRTDPNQNTGISVQNCKVAAASDLIPVKSNFSTYLGRPWKEYSRTVFMESYLEDLIAPAGWLEWNGTFGLDTLYYGEYMNRGPGAGTGNRVTWPGYRVIVNATEASQFTVQNFIQGTDWLPQSGFPFATGLAL
ncbi:pectinesterase-like [Nymphaea colorata]|nr:pectinesterase-like [Nymphaea colorata]